MCLITFAYKIHSDYKLLLVANRDEFYNRPTDQANFWPNLPYILGGKDRQATAGWVYPKRVGSQQ